MQPAAKVPATPPTAAELSETFELFRRVGLAMKSRFQDALAEHNLSFPQWWLMKTLRRSVRLTATELAAAIDVTPANVTGMVDRLAREGLVERSRSEEDRRVVYVHLSQAGLAKMRAVEEHGAASVLREAFVGWSAEDLGQLRVMLARLKISTETEC